MITPKVFDIETLNWVIPVAIGFYDGERYYDFIQSSESDDVTWRFLEFLSQYPGARLFAHNAADFDNKFILDCLKKHNQTIKFSGGMAKLVWVENDISFEDSYLMIGRGLTACCQVFGVEQKLNWDHSKTERPYKMRPTDFEKFRSYLKRDVLALTEVLDKFCRKVLDYFNIMPSASLSLTAVKAFDKNFYDVKNIEANEKLEPFIRAATYGGRNEIYRRYGENLNLYDVRSMYTSCYDTPVPVSKMNWIAPRMDRGTLAEARVSVPKDMFIGPLPYRILGRLIFPVGVFKGWWDMCELRNAAKLGVDITLVRQLECEELPILKEFGDYVSQLRKVEQESTIWKLLGLRLSGKFGQSRIRSEIRQVEEIEELEGWTPIDKDETYYERQIYVGGKKSPYIKPAISMRVRAEARVRHLAYMNEAKDVYYCDTDSVHTTSILPIGSEAGQLQLTDIAERAYFIRCKLYGYINDKKQLIQRSAGFRDFKLLERDFAELLAGGTVVQSFQSPGDWKGIMKGKGVQLINRHRSVKSEVEFENRKSIGLDTEPLSLPFSPEIYYSVTGLKPTEELEEVTKESKIITIDFSKITSN